MSCVPLVKDGSVEPDYADAIISCVEEYGPYIVFFPGFALPHTQQGSSKAHKTALSFMKTACPVDLFLVTRRRLLLCSLLCRLLTETLIWRTCNGFSMS